MRLGHVGSPSLLAKSTSRNNRLMFVCRNPGDCDAAVNDLLGRLGGGMAIIPRWAVYVSTLIPSTRIRSNSNFLRSRSAAVWLRSFAILTITGSPSTAISMHMTLIWLLGDADRYEPLFFSFWLLGLCFGTCWRWNNSTSLVPRQDHCQVTAILIRGTWPIKPAQVFAMLLSLVLLRDVDAWLKWLNALWN